MGGLVLDYYGQCFSVKFAGGESVEIIRFICGGCFRGYNMSGIITYLRDMKDDYGIIPMPKYDEAQKNYRSQIAKSGLLSKVILTPSHSSVLRFLL